MGAQIFALYSAVGLLFMSWVGILLINQPFYVSGVVDIEKAKGSAFGAAATFFFSFLVSVYMMCRDTRQLMQYDAEMMDENGMHSSSQSLTLDSSRVQRGGISLRDFTSSIHSQGDELTSEISTRGLSSLIRRSNSNRLPPNAHDYDPVNVDDNGRRLS